MDDNKSNEILDRLQKVEAAIADIRAAIKIDREQTIGALKEINDYLWPAVYKLFPKVAEDHLRINKLLGGKEPPSA